MLTDEQVMPLAELAKKLPRTPAGRRIHVATLWRWCTGGCRGVVLESRRLGNRYFSSVEAVDRFSARLAELGRDRRGQTSAESRRVLDSAGI